MSKSVLSFSRIALLAGVAVWCAADSAQAQFGVHGGGGRGDGRGGWGVGIGSPYYGGYGHYYGDSYSPYYGGYYGNSYYPYSYGYAPYSYGYAPYSPSYTYYLPATSDPAYTNSTRISNYPPQTDGAPPAQFGGEATIEVMVPGRADVTIDGNKTKQTGPDRLFNTPAVPEGKTFTYKICATWMDNAGNEVKRTRTVHVAPNQHTFVNFMDSGAQDNGNERLPAAIKDGK